MSRPAASQLKLSILAITAIVAFLIVRSAPNPLVALGLLWVAAFLLPYVLGPILIRRTQWMSTEETSEPADLGDESVPRDVARTYRFVDGELAKLGFERLLSTIDRGRVTNATVYLAMYRNRETKEVARFLAAVAENRQARNFNPVLSFSNEFADGTEVYTANGRGPKIGPRLGPPVHAFDFPEVGEVDRLHRLHRTLVRRFEGGRLRVDPTSDPAGLQRRVNRRYKEMVVARGYYAPDDEHQRLRLTWKGAILIAWQLAWPVKPLAAASRKLRSARLIRQLEAEGRDDGFAHPY